MYLDLVRGKIHDYGWYVRGIQLRDAADLLNAEAAYQVFHNDPIAGQKFRLRDGPLVPSRWRSRPHT